MRKKLLLSSAMFIAAIESEYEVRDFDPAEHPSEHQTRRNELLEKALAGEKIEAPAETKPADDGVDLMALLTASVDEKKPARRPRKTKVTA